MLVDFCKPGKSVELTSWEVSKIREDEDVGALTGESASLLGEMGLDMLSTCPLGDSGMKVGYLGLTASSPNK